MISVKRYHFDDSELKKVWFEIENDSYSYIFQSYHWCQNWIKKIGINKKKYEIFILVASENDKPIAIFPFVIKKFIFFSILEFIGDDQFDYNSPLIRKNTSNIESIWSEIKEKIPKHDVKVFKRLPEFLGENFNPFLKLFPKRIIQLSHQLFLKKNSENTNLISKRTKKNVLRSKRKLSELGNLDIFICENSNDYEKTINETLKQKEKKYIETGVRNILHKKIIKNFYTSLFQLNQYNLNVHLSSLNLNGEILATHLGFIYKKTFYYIFPTYKSSQYDKYSPGKVLLYELVQLSTKHEMKIFDLTIGSEDYKKKWSNSSMKIYTCCEYKSLKGFLYLIFFNLFIYLKNFEKLKKSILIINKRLKIIK